MTNSESSVRAWRGQSMLRRIVPLVGAMLAAMAMLGAANASAEPVGLFIAGSKSEEVAKQPRFEAEKYAATIKSTALTSFEFTAQGGKLKCSELSLPGSISGATKELAFNQVFWPCTLFGWSTQIFANGCHLELNVLNSGPPYTGTTDVACPAGQGIEFIGFGGGMTKCTLRIPSQNGVEGVSFENTGTGSARAVTVNFNLTSVKYTQTAGTGLAKCTSGEFSNGIFTVSDSLAASK